MSGQSANPVNRFGANAYANYAIPTSAAPATVVSSGANVNGVTIRSIAIKCAGAGGIVHLAIGTTSNPVLIDERTAWGMALQSPIIVPPGQAIYIHGSASTTCSAVITYDT